MQTDIKTTNFLDHLNKNSKVLNVNSFSLAQDPKPGDFWPRLIWKPSKVLQRQREHSFHFKSVREAPAHLPMPRVKVSATYHPEDSGPKVLFKRYCWDQRSGFHHSYSRLANCCQSASLAAAKEYTFFFFNILASSLKLLVWVKLNPKIFFCFVIFIFLTNTGVTAFEIFAWYFENLHTYQFLLIRL